MRSIAILLLCVGMLFSANQASARTLELVTLQYPPYEYAEEGEVKGFVVDIVTEVFRRMQQPIHISLLPWARSIQMIENGTADAIFTAYKTPEREAFADYSKEILMPQIISLFVLKESTIQFDGDFSKLANYRFGAVRKVSYGRIFDKAVTNGLIQTPDMANTGEKNIDKLLTERFDILVSNKYGALEILKKKGLTEQVKELKPAVENVPSYIAFSKQRNLTQVRDEFDAVLAEMKRDGTYERIIANYFN